MKRMIKRTVVRLLVAVTLYSACRPLWERLGWDRFGLLLLVLVVDAVLVDVLRGEH